MGDRKNLHQSCGAACATPINPSTGEFLVPAATRATQVIEHTRRVTEAIQGALTVARFLDEAQKQTVEEILKDRTREANRTVDEQLFGKGRSLPDSECEKAPVVQEKQGPTWRRHLGKIKHTAAFNCIQTRLSQKFPNNFTIEPRYRKGNRSPTQAEAESWTEA
ncbi:hypothetical protein [Melittangium boletus]|uniref:Uncharacterized protein n=1 Tax=Melittangium boletus DSM 14713 TaxID=1294270 RepID=A0A250IC26_9BACT|nr:hypothetical protein [Melittangium boletus]ATB28506.1 hypothetical protein MEBOL_001954 [Melittangium boletus DSM 14713]